ncbi:MAG: NAD-dependent protein deacylase [Clostridia bacterium]|jgi:NAD-dependent deacetylase
MIFDNVVERIIKSNKIVFFTGAGVSTESGIPDFRSDNGLYAEKYNGYSPETILSHSFFFSNPQVFYKFYFDNVVHADTKPNDFHYGISKIQNMKYDVTVVTQNIDDLHNIAHNKNVLELHGNINSNHCIKCGKYYSLNNMLDQKDKIVRCNICNSLVKPDVILYEEQLNEDIITKSIYSISDADVIIVAGTSLSVYPAASFIDYYNKDCLIIINKAKTLHDTKADFVFNDSCSKVLNTIIEKLELFR